MRGRKWEGERGGKVEGEKEGWNCLDGSTGRRMIKEERKSKGEDGQIDNEIES